MTPRVSRARRAFLIAVLLYLALDFTHPSIPGAVSFDPDACTEGVRAERGRAHVLAPCLSPVPAAFAAPERATVESAPRREAPVPAPAPRHRPHKRPALPDRSSPTDDH